MQPPTQPPPPPFGSQFQNTNKVDDLGTGLKIVSFCFPIVGLIFYFMKKEKEPIAAKQACTFGLIGFILGLIINVIYFVAIGLSN